MPPNTANDQCPQELFYHVLGLWYRFGAELLLLLLAAPLSCWAIFSVAFHHAERAPRREARKTYQMVQKYYGIDDCPKLGMCDMIVLDMRGVLLSSQNFGDGQCY